MMATNRQAKAIENIVENGGNVSKAMRDAGYSPQTAKTPQKLTNSIVFQKYMQDAGLTDEKLVQVLKDGLDATKVIVMGQGSGESFVDVTPDHPTRHKFLETSLKIRGIGKDEGSGQSLHFHQHLESKKDDYAF